MASLTWERFADTGLHRGRIDGRTVAAIDRSGSAAIIVAADRHGREMQAQVIGDTLEQNKQTAADMHRARGHNI